MSNLQAIEDLLAICRHPLRPTAIDYIHHIVSPFEELHGDRTHGDDKALIGGLGYVGDQKVVILAQERGRNPKEHRQRNFGMMHPEGYRKALKLMKLAEQFHLPVLSFIDTKGAYPGLEAEERGQAWAISQNISAMLSLQTPILGILLGEGCSGGALGIGIVDHLAMLEYSYYTVISPESCAAILWRDTQRTAQCAQSLKMQSQDMLRYGVADTCISEPPGGAHKDPALMYQRVKNHIQEQLQEVGAYTNSVLIQKRAAKYRTLGASYLL